jgi:agmatinase
VLGGLSFPEATALLRHVVESGRPNVVFDQSEVAPEPAGGEWDGKVGARVLYKLIGFGLMSRRD